MNRLDAELLADEFEAKSIDKTVISRIKELADMLDKSYGVYRKATDMGGFIFFFEDIQSYQSSNEKIFSFYHLDKNLIRRREKFDNKKGETT